MSKITLNNVADLTQVTSAQTTINTNSSTVQTAFDNTLSRDGTQPNTMGSNLDMNNNQILNLPSPATVNSPARLIDVASNPSITVPPVGTSGAVVPLLNTANTWSGVQTINANANLNGTTTTVSGNLAVSTANSLQLAGSTGTTTLGTQSTASGTVTLPNGPATLLSTNGATLNVGAGNPATTASLSEVMMGLGSTFRITPNFSSRVFVSVVGQIANSTASDGALARLKFGTGTAPVNGAAAAGSNLSSTVIEVANNANTANVFVPFCQTGIMTGLTPGTSYWIDSTLAAISGGTAVIINPGCTAFEI